MLDRKAKKAVHCCFMYRQQNCEITSECRIFIIDDSVIERAQLDFRSCCIDLNDYIDYEAVESQLLSLFAFPVVFMC